MATEDVFDLGEHLRDGLWRVDSAALPDLRGVSAVAVVGEDAALAGARLALGAPSKPVTFGESAGDSLVVCLSYDGQDAAALAALEAARGPVVVATTGGALGVAARDAGHKVVPIPAGFSPESALGYWVSITAELLARAGAQPSRQAEIEAAADAVEALAARWSAITPGPAQLVEALAAARSNVLADGDTALQSALSAVLLVDVVTYHLGSPAGVGP
jgi:hypothetical protein